MKKKSLIKKLVPVNYLEEKEKFFLNNNYNPQFVYKDSFTEDDLVFYGIPQNEYLQRAEFILEKTFLDSTELELYEQEGRQLSELEVMEKVKKYMTDNKLDRVFSVNTSSTLSSRTMMTDDDLIIRIPVDYREEGLSGMLDHELGTHALREINYIKQPWYEKKEEFGFSSYLRTEEGLASLHSLLTHTNKSAFISAQRYLASHIAQKSSFVETWHKVSKYFDSKERLWAVIFRQKRGLRDTSLPGGFTKDIAYLEGFIEIFNWLKNNDFDLAPLYFGKMSYLDIDKAQDLNPDFKPQLPLFFIQDKDTYINKILEIGGWNEF